MDNGSPTVFETEEELRRFWSWIDLARDDWAAFESRLGELELSTLVRFIHTFKDRMEELHEALEEVDFGPLLEGHDSVSEDHIEDFCGWMVVRGAASVRRWLADPETIEAAEDFSKQPGIDVLYAAERVYEARSGEPPPAY